jgi:hypothetical protein
MSGKAGDAGGGWVQCNNRLVNARVCNGSINFLRTTIKQLDSRSEA